ncbi:MAG: LamG domain-containing protein [Candidatus Omnitrophica bacterium]|nr:LamG domain-containing protein [Candidatus Omnitrophota bacterium]
MKNLIYNLVIGIFFCQIAFSQENLPGKQEEIYLYFSFDKGVQPDYAISGVKNSQFSRNSIATKKDGTDVSENIPILEKGISGKGIYLGNGVTNILLANQSDVEEGIDGFTSIGKAELIQSDTESWHNLASLQVKTTKLLESGFSVSAKVTGGKYQIVGPSTPTFVPNKYVFSIYLKGEGSLRIYLKDETNNITGKVENVILTKDWKRYWCYIDLESSAEITFYCLNAEGKQITFFADGLQLEKKTPPGYYGADRTVIIPSPWTKGGSFREPDTLIYPANLTDFPFEEGSLSFWFKPDYPVNDGEDHEFWQFAWNYFACRKQLYSELLLWAGREEQDGKSGSASAVRVFTPEIGWIPETWHFVVGTWSNKEGLIALYLDGKQIGKAKGWRTKNIWFPENPYHGIGCSNVLNPAVKILRANAVLDDFTFWKKPLTCEEIKTIYENGKKKIEEVK